MFFFFVILTTKRETQLQLFFDFVFFYIVTLAFVIFMFPSMEKLIVCFPKITLNVLAFMLSICILNYLTFTENSFLSYFENWSLTNGLASLVSVKRFFEQSFPL